jgi:hypothetical protein
MIHRALAAEIDTVAVGQRGALRRGGCTQHVT